MPATVSHALSMSTPDDPAYENKPSDWNKTHAVTLNISATEISGLFSNANGVTFGLSNNSITGSIASTYAGTGFTSASTAGVDIKGTNNSAGLSLGVPAYITTARASNDAIGLNTAQTNVTWTVDSRGISFNAGGYNGTGFTSTTTAGTAVVATNNTSGLSMGVPAFLTTAMASGRGTDFVQATAAFAGTNASGTINSTGISVSVAKQGTVSSWSNAQVSWAPVGFVAGNNNIAIHDFICPIYVTGTRVDVMVSVSVTTAANASTAGINFSHSFVFYTQNGASLNSVSSTTQSGFISWSNNNTGNATGYFFLSAPVNVNMTPGRYQFGAQISTAATGNGLTGANTTSLGNTISAVVIGSSAVAIRELNQASANSANWNIAGIYSDTTNITQINLANMSMTGNNGARAPYLFRIQG